MVFLAFCGESLQGQGAPMPPPLESELAGEIVFLPTEKALPSGAKAAGFFFRRSLLFFALYTTIEDLHKISKFPELVRGYRDYVQLTEVDHLDSQIRILRMEELFAKEWEKMSPEQRERVKGSARRENTYNLQALFNQIEAENKQVEHFGKDGMALRDAHPEISALDVFDAKQGIFFIDSNGRPRRDGAGTPSSAPIAMAQQPSNKDLIRLKVLLFMKLELEDEVTKKIRSIPGIIAGAGGPEAFKPELMTEKNRKRFERFISPKEREASEAYTREIEKRIRMEKTASLQKYLDGVAAAKDRVQALDEKILAFRKAYPEEASLFESFPKKPYFDSNGRLRPEGKGKPTDTPVAMAIPNPNVIHFKNLLVQKSEADVQLQEKSEAIPRMIQEGGGEEEFDSSLLTPRNQEFFIHYARIAEEQQSPSSDSR